MSDMSSIYKLEKTNPKKIILWTLLFLGGVVMITPIVFMASTSFKTGQEIYFLNIIPKDPTLENYNFILFESKFVNLKD